MRTLTAGGLLAEAAAGEAALNTIKDETKHAIHCIGETPS